MEFSLGKQAYIKFLAIIGIMLDSFSTVAAIFLITLLHYITYRHFEIIGWALKFVGYGLLFTLIQTTGFVLSLDLDELIVEDEHNE